VITKADLTVHFLYVVFTTTCANKVIIIHATIIVIHTY